MSPQAEFTIGVEEEYQIINPQTRQLSSMASLILSIAQSTLGNKLVQPEFRQSQLEIATPICYSLKEVRLQLLRLRSLAIAAAAQSGNCLAAAGTHPFSHWQMQPITPKPSYQKLVQNYQYLMQELVTFGCHVHIGLSKREIAIGVMNRARVWLAPMLALSASSPFWLGKDTGYASYRTMLIASLPMTGPPLIFESYREYRAVVRSLLTTNTIQKATQVCWDIRLSERFPTIEFRVSDVCITIDEAVMIAGLIRALVHTCYEQELSNTPYKIVRPELLRVAQWCASRSGLDEKLLDVEIEQSIPAKELIDKFLSFLHPALQKFGDWDEVSSIVRKTIQHGNGAARQRIIYERTDSLKAVVDFVIQETAKGTSKQVKNQKA
jgi:carboxylate-amine ligase